MRVLFGRKRLKLHFCHSDCVPLVIAVLLRVLIAALPRWPLSWDCIVVWLRTRVCPVVFEKESDDDSETDAMLWGDIPESEVLAADCAAPCARHLLVKPPTYA